MILRIILVALRNLLRQPFRTFLILQGVIWGTALGVFPPAVINGSMHLAETQASRLGTDRVLITQDTEAATRFDWSLLDKLRADPTVRHATGLFVTGTDAESLTFLTTDSDALAARAMRLAAGRFFTADEVKHAAPVCVVEHEAARRLFGTSDPIGQKISDDSSELEIIGVTASRAADGELLDELGYYKDHPMRRLLDEMKQYVGVFDDPELAWLTNDAAVMIPHTLMSNGPLQFIELRANPRDVLPLRDRLQEELSAAGYEPIIYSNAILPVLYGETLKSLLQLNRTVFVLSICVGTAIVCAIMVLSVVERQREIAIRRVEGARQWHIALQFVVETGTLCLVGGVAGVPLGLGIAAIRCAFEPMGSVTWVFPPLEVSIIIVVVTAIGLIGGLLPAWRAMRVDPVEMLRYE
jgi:putative ABC transport system permease protein